MMTLINPLANAHFIVPPPTTQSLKEEKDQSLRREQIVRATVDEGGLNRIRLEINGKKTWVETEVAFKTGQKLQLEIFETENGPELRLRSPGLVDRLNRSLYLLNEKFNLHELLAKLVDPNNQLSQGVPARTQSAISALLSLVDELPQVDGALLKNISRILGLDFEAQLLNGRSDLAVTSLKGILHDLQLSQNNGKGALPAGLAKLVDILDTFQYARATLLQTGLALAPLPLPFLETGYLICENQTHDKQAGEEESHHKITLQLKLPQLGWMRIGLLWQGGGLFTRIECALPTTRKLCQQHQDIWQQLLEPHGLQRISIVETSEDLENSLARRLSSANNQMLNARI